MKRFSLSLPLKDESLTQLELEGSFQNGEFKKLRQFVAQVKRIRDSSLLQRGMPSISNIKFESKTGITLKCEEYTNAELYELLHVLRPVLLDDEASSFHRVTSLIGQRTKDETLQGYLKIQRKVFTHGELSLMLQISIDDQPIFHDSTIKLWLNGTQYHTDGEKAKSWAKLENTLTEEGARALVMAQLHSKVTAVFNIDYITRQVLAANDEA